MTDTLNPKMTLVKNAYRSLIKSASMTFSRNWSDVQLHHGIVQSRRYKAVKFSVCGGPGANGKVVNFMVKGGTHVPITLTAGTWEEFTVQLSQIGNPSLLDNFIFQDNGNSSPRSPYTMHIDNIMFVE